MWTKLNFDSPTVDSLSNENRHNLKNAIDSFLENEQPGAQCFDLSVGTNRVTYVKVDGDHQSALRVFGIGANALEEAKAEVRFLQTCFSESSRVAVVKIVDEELAVLEMALLSPALPSPSEVVAVHHRYESHITETNLEGLFDRDRDISALVTGAQMAIDPLEGNIDLRDNDLARANSLLEKLRGYLDGSPRVPCHGDLSPANILQNADGDFVVIDWEDRFWGVRDYDFLYWLTFMKNASHLNRETLQHLKHPHDISVAILVIIVIVKESVSLKAAVPRAGRVSPAARIHAVLELL